MYVSRRAVEFTGKSGIYGLRYLSDGGFVKIKHYHDFIKFEMLRKEYLNQTFNFMPELKGPYMNKTRSTYYDVAQEIINNKDEYARAPNDTLRASVDYFSILLLHLVSLLSFGTEERNMVKY